MGGDIFSSPALATLLALEDAGCQIELWGNRLYITPASRIPQAVRGMLASQRDALKLLTRICDEGVQSRRELFRSQGDTASYLVCPGLPWEPARCFSCGDPNESTRHGRCWRCALAWRLAAGVSISTAGREWREVVGAA